MSTDARTAVTNWMLTSHTGDLDAAVAGMLARPAWTKLAACRGEPIGTFFTDPAVDPFDVGYDRAREICARCGVIDDCLAYAMTDREDVGFFGGATGFERRKKRRRRKSAA